MSISHKLHYIDRGNAIKRRDELLIAYGKRAKSGENRFTDRGEIISPLQTTASIAKDIGVTARTVQQEKQIARDILPEAQEAIKAADLLLQAGHPSIMYNDAFIMYEI